MNTGTWLKQFDRITPRFGFLPAIYVPFYCLNYFKAKAEGNSILFEYVKIDKSTSEELSWLQRLMVGRTNAKKTIIQKKSIIEM